jgi:hypothetical protein
MKRTAMKRTAMKNVGRPSAERGTAAKAFFIADLSRLPGRQSPSRGHSLQEREGIVTS